jgi:hypothetical protein
MLFSNKSFESPRARASEVPVWEANRSFPGVFDPQLTEFEQFRWVLAVKELQQPFG